MTTHALAPLLPIRVATRRGLTISLIGTAMILMVLGAALPWLVVFNGLTTVPGLSLDGGFLAGIMVAVVCVLYVAARHGGARILRPIALVASAAVLADSLYSGWRIAGYIEHPGSTAALTVPSAGPGPYVMAAGAAILFVAAAIAPHRISPLARQALIRLLLALVLLTAASIHLILSPQHFSESPLLGVGFLLAGIVQLGAAAVVLTRADDRGLNLVLLVSIALIAIYGYAVFVGLPLDSEHAADTAGGLTLGAGEPVDFTGLVNVIAQITAIPLALILARHSAATAPRQVEPAHDAKSQTIGLLNHQ